MDTRKRWNYWHLSPSQGIKIIMADEKQEVEKTQEEKEKELIEEIVRATSDLYDLDYAK